MECNDMSKLAQIIFLSLGCGELRHYNLYISNCEKTSMYGGNQENKILNPTEVYKC
jgi:hypothetical protein